MKLTKIKNEIQLGNLDQSISTLIQITGQDSSRYHNEVILHSAKFQEIRTSERKNILTPDDLRREKSRLVDALLDLIDAIEEEYEARRAVQSPRTSAQNEPYTFEFSDKAAESRIKELIKTHQDRLHRLQVIQAKMGLRTPVDTELEIEEVKRQIEQLQQELTDIYDLRNQQ